MGFEHAHVLDFDTVGETPGCLRPFLNIDGNIVVLTDVSEVCSYLAAGEVRALLLDVAGFNVEYITVLGLHLEEEYNFPMDGHESIVTRIVEESISVIDRLSDWAFDVYVMSKKIDRKQGSAKSILATAGAMLAMAAVEALRAGELVVSGSLIMLALTCFGASEVLSQRQFAFEDELAELLGDGEMLAGEFEDVVRENQDELRDALDSVE